MPRTAHRLSALLLGLVAVATVVAPAASADPAPTPAPAPAPAPVDPALPLVPPLVAELDAGTAAEFARATAVAKVALDKATGELAAAQAEATDLAAKVRATEAEQRAASAARAAAAHRLDETRSLVRQYAVAQYKSTAVPADPNVFTSSSFVEASRRDKFDAAADDRFTAVMHDYLEQRDAADRRTRAAADTLTQLRDAQRRSGIRIAAASSALTATTAESFHTTYLVGVAGDPAPTIMGTAALRADELVAWYNSRGLKANTTVPIEQLATMYIEEGALTGVRGDIAFIQSIIETGSFTFPGGGLVAGADNNFAGIGACDSCPHGFTFPDARTGVRAQMQALRIYADPFSTNDNLGAPPVMPKNIGVYTHGKVPTWMMLAGTWATATHYGITIHTLYADLAVWILEHPQPVPPASITTAATATATPTPTANGTAPG